MKRLHLFTFILLAMAFMFELSSPALAQEKEVRKSLKAHVSQTVGVDTDVTFEFSRPGVKGRTVWGELVPYGMNEGNKYSKEKPFPWRAGANENTTVEFNNDVLIEGNKIAAGKYGVHMIPAESKWTVIFNKKNEEWGSYSYDEKEDALRITVQPVAASHQEWLNYGFEKLDGNSAVAFLHWEKLKVPFSIKLAE
jgi:DUF2911 family protein